MELFFDISEDQARKLLSEAAHKIKNGLGGISGFAALLERDLGSNDPRVSLARRIQSGVLRLNDFIVDLMTFLLQPESTPITENPVVCVRQVWTEFWGEKDPPQKVLFLPEDASLIRSSADFDSGLFRILVMHAFRFAVSCAGRIDEVHFRSETDGKTVFDVVFPRTDNLQIDSNAKSSKLRACEPIEAKLSLYIVIKMAKFNGGKTALRLQEPDQHVLTVHL
jgi:hypothetical protein